MLAEPALLLNYSHSFFDNGFCRNQSEKQESGFPDTLSFETGSYGLRISLSQLSRIEFGVFESTERLGYVESISKENSARMDTLEEEDMLFKLSVDGQEYIAKTCDASFDSGPKPFNNHVVLWEAGKIAQRYEFLGLRFVQEDDPDTKLEAESATFEIVLWPDSFSINLMLQPLKGKTWPNVAVDVRLKHWTLHQSFPEGWSFTDKKTVSLVCDVDVEKRQTIRDYIQCKVRHGKEAVPTSYSDRFDCHMCSAVFGHGPNSLHRAFGMGYTDIRDYDEFEVKLANTGSDSIHVPFLLYVKEVANSTGLCPVVCQMDGVPTGIPIQLSKNWHNPVLRPYAYFYTFLPVPAKSDVQHLIRVVYGFYGELPSASHAQLSLQGPTTRATGRWEQLAIGCFGETFCMDPEKTANVLNRIMDVRGLMFRKGLNGAKWGWTSCAWGGDWLRVYDAGGTNLLEVSGMKTAYVAHGPCLSDVRYSGYFGEKKQVDFEVRIRTLRTDDYARTFLTFDYKFQDEVTLGLDGYLHMMMSHGYQTPTIAMGCGGKRQLEESVPNGLADKQVFLGDAEFHGNDPPFWVSFTDSFQFESTERFKSRNDMPTGTKHMIIKSFLANVDGTVYRKPSVTFTNANAPQPVWIQGKEPSLFLSLDLGKDVRNFKRGDKVCMEVEWMTTTRTSDDYYGPNNNYRAHLSLYPRSWRTPLREAVYNDVFLDISVVGGQLEHRYPLSIRLTDHVVEIKMRGGVGAVPMEFKGLAHKNYALYQVGDEEEDIRLDQSVHGNDFWQTEYNPSDGTFTLTYNPSLGSQLETKWRLKPLLRTGCAAG